MIHDHGILGPRENVWLLWYHANPVVIYVKMAVTGLEETGRCLYQDVIALKSTTQEEF